MGKKGFNEFFNNSKGVEDLKEGISNYDNVSPLPDEDFRQLKMADQEQSSMFDSGNIRSQQAGLELHAQDTGDQYGKSQLDASYTSPLEQIGMSTGRKLSRSWLAGHGHIVSSVGNMFTFAHALGVYAGFSIPFTDSIGSWLENTGEGITNKDKISYVPRELMDITGEDLANPDFWATNVAEQVPNLFAMMMSGVAGTNFTRKAITKYGGRYAKKKGAKTGTLIATKEGGEILIKKGSGAGVLFNKTGKGLKDIALSKTGSRIAGYGGGALMNIVDGSMVSGQTYRMALEDGLSKEEAAAAAAGTFVDNSKWMALDMFSWGIMSGNLPGRAALNTFNKSLSGSKSFAVKMMGATAKIIPSMGLEATEEMFQESYQDWIQKKNIAHAKGKLFKGPDGEDFEGVDGYLNFFKSPANGNTKWTAFATGLVGGGYGGVVSNIASRQSQLDRQEELFRRSVDDLETNERDSRERVINEVVQRAVELEQDVDLINYINDLAANDKMSEDAKETYLGVIERYSDVYSAVPEFIKETTEGGKVMYFNNLVKIEQGKDIINQWQQKLKEENAREGISEENKKLNEDRTAAKIKIQQQEIDNLQDVNNNIEKEVLVQLNKEVSSEVGGTLSKKEKESYIVKHQEEADNEVDDKEGAEVVSEEDKGKEKSLIQKGLDVVFGSKEKKSKEGLSGTEAAAMANVAAINKSVKDVADAIEAEPDNDSEKIKESMPEKVRRAINHVAERKSNGHKLSKEEAKINSVYSKEVDAKVEEYNKAKREEGPSDKKKVEDSDTSSEEIAKDKEDKEASNRRKKKAKLKGKKGKGGETLRKSKSTRSFNRDLEEISLRQQAVITMRTKEFAEKGGKDVGFLDPQYTKYTGQEALEIAETIFIRPDSTYQEGYVHERSHIQFRHDFKSPLIQKWIKEFANSNEYARIKALYPELVLYNWFGSEVGMPEILDSILERSLDARSRFRDIESINESRKSKGKRPIKKDSADDNMMVILNLAKMAVSRQISGEYNTAEGQLKMNEDFSNLKELLEDANLITELAAIDQIEVHEEGWATYISDPNNPDTSAKAKEIFADIMGDPSKNKKRKERAKSFWKSASRGLNNKEAEGVLKSREDLAKMSNEEMREHLNAEHFKLTPEQIENSRLSRTAMRFSKRNTIYTQKGTFDREMVSFAKSRIIDEIKNPKSKIGSLLKKGILPEAEFKKIVKDKALELIEINSRDGVRKNQFLQHIKKGDPRYLDAIVEEVVLTAMSKANRFIQSKKGDQPIVNADAGLLQTLKDLEKELSDLSGKDSITINEMIDAIRSAMWGDVQNITNYTSGERDLEETLGDFTDTDGILSIYNKNQDQLVSTVSAMFLDFSQSFFSSPEGKAYKKQNPKRMYQKGAANHVMSELLMLAQKHRTTSAEEFIKAVRESKDDAMKGFVSYLEDSFSGAPIIVRGKSRGQQLAQTLNSDYLLANIWVNFRSKIHENQHSSIVEDEAMRERNEIILHTEADMAFEEKGLIGTVQSIMNDWLNEDFNNLDEDHPLQRKKGKAESYRHDFYKDAQKILKNINENAITDVEQAIVDLFTDMYSLAPHGYFYFKTLKQSGVIHNGKRIPLVKWFKDHGSKAFLDKGKGRWFKVNTELLEGMLQQTAVNSRAFHYFTMIRNAENNPTNTMRTRSFLINKKEQLNEFFRKREGESRIEYDERVYDRALALQDENGFNDLLPFNVDEDGLIVPGNLSVSYRGGLVTELRNNGLSYSKMSAAELHVSDMTDFLNAKKTGAEYTQPIAVFAEKTRMYYAYSKAYSDQELTQRLKWLSQWKDDKYANGDRVLTLITENGTWNSEQLNAELSMLKKHIENNLHLYSKNKAFSRYIKDGKLVGADTMLKNYIKNHFVNKFQAQQLLIGDHKQFENEVDYIKRASGAIAMNTPGENNTTVDALVLKDINIDGVNHTDSSGYMLEEDAETISDQYGLNLTRDSNNGAKFFKYVYYGQDLREDGERISNESFNDNGVVYLKSNIFRITKWMEENNPTLQRIAELLRMRKSFMKEEGIINPISVAYNESAIKAFPIKDGHAVDLDLSKSVKSQYEEVSSKLNALYSNSNGKYVGLDGNNFGVQLPLDKEKFSAPVPTQSFAQHLTNATPETKELIEIAHAEIAKAMREQLKESSLSAIFGIDQYNDAVQSALNKKMLSKIKSSWAGVPVANMAEYASPFFPRLNVSRNAILNKLITEIGTKIESPGTIAFQMTGAGWDLEAYKTLGSLRPKYKGAIKGARGKYGDDLIVSEAIVPNSMRKMGFKVGDIILGSRIPSHGKATQPVLVIKDFFDEGAGSTIAVPGEVSNVMGSDFDGDAMFLNTKYFNPNKKSQAAWNTAFDNIVKLNGNIKHIEETKRAISFEDIAMKAHEASVDANGVQEGDWSEESSQLLPMGHLDAFNANVPSGGMIGIAAVMHRDMNYLSHYDVELKFNININGDIVNKFTDENNNSGWFKTAQILNIILDNPKHQFAKKLGLTYQTIKPAMILLRMGYSLDQVAIILNSKAANKYNKYTSERSVIYNDDINHLTAGEKAMVELLPDFKNRGFGSAIEYINKKRTFYDSDLKKIRQALKVKDGLLIDLKDMSSDSPVRDIEIIKLLEELNKVGTEIFNAGRIIGAYGLKIQNGFEVDKLIRDFEDVATSDNSSFKKGTLDGFKKDSIVRQNLRVLEKIRSLDKTTNLQHSNEAVSVQSAINEITSHNVNNIFESNPRNLRNYQLFRMRNELSVLRNMPEKDVIFERLANIQEAERFKPDESQNKFLIDGIIINRESKTISLNNKFIDMFITPQDISILQEHFNHLDDHKSPYSPEIHDGDEIIKMNDVRKMFIQYDFLQHGWLGNSSISVLFSKETFGDKFKINEELDNLLSDNDRNILDDDAKGLAVEFLKHYSYSAPKVTIKRSSSMPEFWRAENSNTARNLSEKGEKHIVKAWNDANSSWTVFEYLPEIGYYQMVGSTEYRKNEVVNHDKTFAKLDVKAYLAGKANRPKFNKSKIVAGTKIGIDQTGIIMTQEHLSESAFYKTKGITLAQRSGQVMEDFYKERYSEYIEDYKHAYNYYLSNIENGKYKKYKESELISTALDFSKFDRLVYDKMMNFIGVELSSRMETEQVLSIAKIAKKNNISLINNDLGAWESWLISNNLHQTNADLQPLIKKMERDNLRFSRRWREVARGIKRTAQEIKIAKLEKYSTWQVFKLWKNGSLDAVIWGGIAKWSSHEDGRKYLTMKTPAELRKSKLSKDEKLFVETWNYVMNKYYPTMESRAIPFKAESGIPSFFRNGLFGLYKANIGSVADISNVKVEATRPDGIKDIMTYKEWETFYQTSKRGFAIETGKYIYELDKIRKKAIENAKNGRHDDGTPIIMNKMARNAMFESDVFLNMIDGKSVAASELGSMDLEDILLHATHTAMFKYGSMSKHEEYKKDVPLQTSDEGFSYREFTYAQWSMKNGSKEFLGMEVNLPLIDGAIHLNKIRGNKEAVKYLQEVWKDGVIGGRKQKSFNGPWDWAINKVVDLTSLAYLGLSIPVAAGNIVMGKYQALRARGGAEFVVGEKRFWEGWYGKEGNTVLSRSTEIINERSISKTLGRNKTAAILNELMKHEYYRFDNISSTHKENPLYRVAFFPLDQSEKWIQGSMFLGMMTDAQWNAYEVRDNGSLGVKAGHEADALSDREVQEMVYKIKQQQGFGYSPLDQRRLSQYSWGRALGQFKRYFMTLSRERFGRETIDMYGNPDIGTYRAAYEFVKDVAQGKKSMADMEKMPKHKQDAIRRYLNGVAIAIIAMLLYGLSGDDDDDGIISHNVGMQAKGFLGDQNIFANTNKLRFMATPPSVSFVKDRIGF